MGAGSAAIKEISAYLRIAEKQPTALTADGKIPGFKVGAACKFKGHEINAWFEDRLNGYGTSD